MPKIIQNIRQQLLAEAQKQIRERGYAKTTIRSVAGACGLGVGTVYNYFPSKEMLVASFMLEDWQICLTQMQGDESDPKTLLQRVYNALCDYIQKHQALFTDKDASKVFAAAFSQRHKQLREHIQTVVAPVCKKDVPFLSEFIAESLLTWTVAGKNFDEIYAVIGLLLR